MGYSRASSQSLCRLVKALELPGFCRRRFDLLAIKRLALQSWWIGSLANALRVHLHCFDIQRATRAGW